jgi:CBS domain-containing protein
MFPVVENGRLIGCVSTSDIKTVPRDQWEKESVGAIARPCGPDNTIAADVDAVEALSRMSRGMRRLLVLDGGRLVGVLSLPDLLRLFSLRMDLGEDAVGAGDRSPAWSRPQG